MLQGDASTAHIPVLALSANAMPRDIEKGLAAGFFRYLTKPIHLDEFMQALDAALDCQRKLSLTDQEVPS
jgi:CheY-like chemotaxis protein